MDHWGVDQHPSDPLSGRSSRTSSAHALNCVRSIHDQAEVPIILAGTADILHHVNDRADGRGQFASRCIFHNEMEGALNVEGPGSGSAGARDLFTLEEIKAFFDMKKIRLADDALDLCWSLACLPNHGTLRSSSNARSIPPWTSTRSWRLSPAAMCCWRSSSPWERRACGTWKRLPCGIRSYQGRWRKGVAIDVTDCILLQGRKWPGQSYKSNWR